MNDLSTLEYLYDFRGISASSESESWVSGKFKLTG